jgi:hypothetical protein
MAGPGVIAAVPTAEAGRGPASDRPPWAFWLLPLAVAGLRGLPYLWSRLAPAGEGQAILRVGYIPQDFLSYLAFVRQAADQGSVLLHDPFTTEPQGERFVLLLHWLLGQVVRITGGTPDLVLELSRVPLTLAFFAVLWAFLRPILPDRGDRVWACLLIGFSGGVEGFLRPFVRLMPDAVQAPFEGAVWHMYGWNTFESLFNPLWIAGFTLLLLVLGPALAPHGPRDRRAMIVMGTALLLLHVVHPYSALAAPRSRARYRSPCGSSSAAWIASARRASRWRLASPSCRSCC